MNRTHVPVLAVSGAALASAVALVVGPGADYARIFPPSWLGLIGAGLAVLSLALQRHRAVAGWAAVVVLLGASGGVMLDGFRAFFAVTGIPAGEFASVDWPGAVARGLDLVAALTTIVFTWRARPAAVPVGARWMLGWGGVVLSVPYPLLKFAWWLEGGSGFPAMELTAFATAAVWVVLLTTTSPGHGLLRFVLAAGGWFSSLALLSMGGLMVFGLLAQVTQVAGAPVRFGTGAASLTVTGVYGSWLALGVVMLASTLLFLDAAAVPAKRSEVAV
ncbi:hypothetical protein ACIBL3_26555 [Kribbella sp. NPDC050124]|uniref:hypothetical protein n=1 Tax=Kribbella sp. NPDC050124 TaxID=3364114 RepID=UPI0037A769C3